LPVLARATSGHAAAPPRSRDELAPFHLLTSTGLPHQDWRESDKINDGRRAACTPPAAFSRCRETTPTGNLPRAVLKAITVCGAIPFKKARLDRGWHRLRYCKMRCGPMSEMGQKRESVMSAWCQQPTLIVKWLTGRVAPLAATPPRRPAPR
jgi:hypothetical protein